MSRSTVSLRQVVDLVRVAHYPPSAGADLLFVAGDERCDGANFTFRSLLNVVMHGCWRLAARNRPRFRPFAEPYDELYPLLRALHVKRELVTGQMATKSRQQILDRADGARRTRRRCHRSAVPLRMSPTPARR